MLIDLSLSIINLVWQSILAGGGAPATGPGGVGSPMGLLLSLTRAS